MSPSSARSSNSSRRATAKKSSNSAKKNPPSNKSPTPKQSAVIITTNITTPPTVISTDGGGPADLKSCQTCGSNQNQHLLALCDVCKFYYHLACLNPPLSKMPKKTRVRIYLLVLKLWMNRHSEIMHRSVLKIGLLILKNHIISISRSVSYYIINKNQYLMFETLDYFHIVKPELQHITRYKILGTIII